MKTVLRRSASRSGCSAEGRITASVAMKARGKTSRFSYTRRASSSYTFCQVFALGTTSSERMYLTPRRSSSGFSSAAKGLCRFAEFADA